MNNTTDAVPSSAIRFLFASQQFHDHVRLIWYSDLTLNKKIDAILKALAKYKKAIVKEVKKK